MQVIKFIIAIILGRVISKLTYEQLPYFQYNTEISFLSFENIVKFLLSYGLAVVIVLVIYSIIIKLFPKKANH